MDSIILWFRSTDWIANALAIAIPVAGIGLWTWKRARSRLSRPRSFSALVKSKLSVPCSMAELQGIAQVAIVDDNLGDFPVSELRKAGFRIKTYRHVNVADFDALSEYDVVFLDMHDIVRDDPTEGGLKLIQVLRQKNPRQKICAVSGNQFNPSATAFFKLADDTLNKPMSAQRCVEVLESFLKEKLDPEGLSRFLDDPDNLSPGERRTALDALTRHLAQPNGKGLSSIANKLHPEARVALVDLSRVASS